MIEDQDRALGPWRGHWIWHEEPDLRRPGLMGTPEADHAPPAWVLMRRTIQLDAVPSRAVARVCADSRYILCVNGVELSRGPVRSHPSRLRYDLVDLAPALRVGPNVVSAVVRFYGKATPWWMPSVPTHSLGAGGFLLEAEIGAELLVSDGSWKALKSDAWSDVVAPGIGGPPEIFDARKLPTGWQTAEFDDSTWGRAVELASNHFGFDGDPTPSVLPYGALLPRPIAQLTGQSRSPLDLLPRSVSGGKDSLVLDFGLVVSGSIVLEVDSAAGAEVKIGLGEGVETVVGLGETTELLTFVTPGGRSRFESFDSFGFRFMHLSVSSDRAVTVESVAVQERLHPRMEGPFFECSDPMLNKIWAVGRRTLDICSHDAYIDCPTREQRAWVGDAAISQAVDMVSNANWDLARWNVELLASPRSDGMLPMAASGDFEHLNFTYIPDFACHWIHALEWLRCYTADRDLVAKLLPVAENILRWFVPYQGEDGLLSGVSGWVFIDWAAVSTRGRCAALNGLWGRALLDFVEISDWLGDAGRASWARRRHEELREGFERFWDPIRELYVDQIVDGEAQRAVSQHAQAAAVVGGLVPEGRLPAMVAHLVDSGRLVDTYWGDQAIGGPPLTEGLQQPTWNVEDQMVKAQPGFRSVVHDALVLAGGRDLLPEACREWATMFDRCDTSFSETWTAGTVSHAWSSTPTRDLIIYTAGVTPTEPGFATVKIAPALGDLEWVRAATPVPAGMVSVDIGPTRVVIDSPVPVVFDPALLWGGEPIRLDPGQHAIAPP